MRNLLRAVHADEGSLPVVRMHAEVKRPAGYVYAESYPDVEADVRVGGGGSLRPPSWHGGEGAEESGVHCCQRYPIIILSLS